MAKVSDFLNPESMITPGVAGGITMTITNTLTSQFSLPGRWTALAISFLCGLLVFVTKRFSFGKKLVFYVINSLIIFTVATGTNYYGTVAQTELSYKISNSLYPITRIFSPTNLYAQEEVQPKQEFDEKQFKIENLNMEIENLEKLLNDKQLQYDEIITVAIVDSLITVTTVNDSTKIVLEKLNNEINFIQKTIKGKLKEREELESKKKPFFKQW